MEDAPLFAEIADGPDGGQGFWTRSDDGVRLRLGYWPATKARGTVLLFPGRTEYVEKYGPTARDLAKLGLSTLTIDWRGQGLSDRACDNKMVGHVRDFAEFQLDVATMLRAVEALDMPKPLYLLSHSMGGCIALRALHKGLPVQAAAFSAPMWGILMAPSLRPFAWLSSWLTHHATHGCKLAPGTAIETYVKTAPFEDNQLTTDRDMFEMMQKQAEQHPELTLGGPSMSWLYAALAETRALLRLPAPDYPVETFLGTHERIVDPDPVHALMARWGDKGCLRMIDGAEHEILMERPETRKLVYARLEKLFRVGT